MCANPTLSGFGRKTIVRHGVDWPREHRLQHEFTGYGFYRTLMNLRRMSSSVNGLPTPGCSTSNGNRTRFRKLECN